MSRLGAVARLVLCDIKAEARRTAIVLGVSVLLFCLLITLFFFLTVKKCAVRNTPSQQRPVAV